jgi:nitroimidazol reductase NimA-like FMN-containing flavoprotein (pyridoxamine 5'-phosphate oxidase superfamily)
MIGVMRSEIELDAQDCRTLLERGVVGRIAFWAPDGPRIHPVNYAVVDDALVVRTTPTSALGRLAHEHPGTVVAFEVDGIDHADQHGWSVQARGPLAEVEDGAELAEIERSRPPRTWAPGERTSVVRVRWRDISGRRLGTGWDPVRDQGYRRVT